MSVKSWKVISRTNTSGNGRTTHKRSPGLILTSDIALELLSTISLSAPWHLQKHTLPLLFSSLPDRPPTPTASVERLKSWRVLSTLGNLCVQPELFDTLVVRLTAILDFLLLQTSPPWNKHNAAYAYAILTTLFKTLTVKVDKHHADVVTYSNRLVPALYGLFISSCLSADDNVKIGMDPRLIDISAQVITLIVRMLPLL